VYHHGLDFAKKHHCYYNHIEDSCECDCPVNEKQLQLGIAERRASQHGSAPVKSAMHHKEVR
jgi:hypothetical protein